MKLDVKNYEFYLLITVILLSFAANLADQNLVGFLDRKDLLIVLAVAVAVVLVRHLRLFLLLCVLTLAAGANLPAAMAKVLGIDSTVMVYVLVLLVVISLINSYFKMLPVDRSSMQVEKEDSEESRKAVLIAITHGQLNRLKWLIDKNVELNFTEGGKSPVLLAAEHGQSEIMQLLIHHGANLNVASLDGRTPMEIALSRGFTRTAEIIKFASENLAVPVQG